MKIGVELEFFICHKSDETFYMPDIISRYLKYNSGFISMQKDSNGICIKAKNELGVTISFEFTYSIIEFSIDPQYDILSLHSIITILPSFTYLESLGRSAYVYSIALPMRLLGSTLR